MEQETCRNAAAAAAEMTRCDPDFMVRQTVQHGMRHVHRPSSWSSWLASVVQRSTAVTPKR
jgi:hypothetical protein